MHDQYMRRALTIARFGLGRTSPNPMVGAVVVKDGSIVGEGWHRKAGTPHAEVYALAQAGAAAAGATVYVTLEPCAHQGRTPPCSLALIEAGVARVVVACGDPNPLVAGKGIAALREKGIEVVEGVQKEAALRLNEVFFKWMTTGIPFITLKTAMTLDGKIATRSGASKWITGARAREMVHRMRDCNDAIAVGIGTVLMDDPSLTTRLASGGKNPIRIIVDSMARTPLEAKVIRDRAAETIVAVTTRAPVERTDALRAAGARVMFAGDGKQVDLPLLFRKLGEEKITSVLVEGGSALNGALLCARLPDKAHVFIAPKLVGGKEAPTLAGGEGVDDLNDALPLDRVTSRMVGGDILISGYIRKGGAQHVYRNH